MKTKLTLLLLCFCSSVFSESYIVTSHTPEGKLFSQIFKRFENGFLVTSRIGEEEITQGLNIFYEKNDLLILGRSYDNTGIESLEGMEFHYIDKKLRKFYSATLTRMIITDLESGEVSPGKVQDLVIISD